MLGKRERHIDIETLSLYIDRRLTPSHHERISQHLKHCERCRREYESLHQTVHLLRHLPRVAVPRAFTLTEQDVRHIRPVRGAWGWMQWATAVVAALLALVISIDLFVQTFAPASAPVPALERPAAVTLEVTKELAREQVAPVAETPLAMKALPRQESLEGAERGAPAKVLPTTEKPLPGGTAVETPKSPEVPTPPAIARPNVARWPPHRWLAFGLAALLAMLLIWQHRHRTP